MTYHLKKINEISDGDQSFVEAVVMAFIEEIPEDLITLEKAVHMMSHEMVYQTTHKIKPNLDLLGMEEVYAINIEILENAKAEKNDADIQKQFIVLKTKLEENISQLKKDFNL